jgi:glycosyltransferase involved in cell wall biosynthesis
MALTAPLVSILIPAFDAERWIARTLESALGQTWPNTEIVVVDDGSRDCTAEIAAGFATRGVRLIRQENLGQCAAENRAFEECRGQFVQYLDADDLLSPDKISRQMARLGDEADVVASGQWARFYSHPSEAVFRLDAVSRDFDPVEWLTRAWTGGLPMMQAGIWLIPRTVALRAGPWDEHLSLINDFEYFTRVLLAAREVRFCDGARLFYRSGNPHSLAGRKSRAAWESALLSLEQGTAALLDREQSPRTRRACADVFQEWAHAAYLEAPDVFERLEARVVALGGSSVGMGGGLGVRVLERVFGWKVAKRLQMLAHRRGFGHVSRLKARWLVRGSQVSP